MPAAPIKAPSAAAIARARDDAILRTVSRFQRVQAKQLERLFFRDGSATTWDVRCRRVLARLVKQQRLSRLRQRIQLFGSNSRIYAPSGRKRAMTLHLLEHTLMNTELYVQLVELDRAGRIELMAYDPEPFCHIEVGTIRLEPDAFARLRAIDGKARRRWLEFDRATESDKDIRAKLTAYVNAFEQWDVERHGKYFPRIVFVVDDDNPGRALTIQRLIAELPREAQALFRVSSFGDAITELTT